MSLIFDGMGRTGIGSFELVKECPRYISGFSCFSFVTFLLIVVTVKSLLTATHEKNDIAAD